LIFYLYIFAVINFTREVHLFARTYETTLLTTAECKVAQK